ncbi:MAG TPA: HNH endonuclease, partial [Anaerolineales bacterium]
EVFRRDNYTCQYCGKRDGGLTVDHVRPRHLGGEHIWTNVVAACPPCNHRKGGRRVVHTWMGSKFALRTRTGSFMEPL